MLVRGLTMKIKEEKSIIIPIKETQFDESAFIKATKKVRHILRKNTLMFLGAMNKLMKIKHPKFILFASRKKIKRRKA